MREDSEVVIIYPNTWLSQKFPGEALVFHASGVSPCVSHLLDQNPQWSMEYDPFGGRHLDQDALIKKKTQVPLVGACKMTIPNFMFFLNFCKNDNLEPYKMWDILKTISKTGYPCKMPRKNGPQVSPLHKVYYKGDTYYILLHMYGMKYGSYIRIS